MAFTAIALQTLFSAFLWATFGYLSRQSDESFQPEKLLSTLVSTIIVAFLQVAYGIDQDTGQTIVIYFIFKTGFIGVIDKLIKVIWRRTGLKDWWSNLEL